MRLVIYQIKTPSIAEVADLTYPTIDDYALSEGIKVVRVNLPNMPYAQIAKNKISGIIRLLEMDYSHVLWIDTDAYVQTPTPLAITDADLHISKDVNGINAGVMILSQNALPALRLILEMDMNHNWGEQWLMMQNIDLFSVCYLPQRDFNAYFYELYAISHPEGQVYEGSFIVHLPGLPNSDRISILKQKRDL
jgi:hypothetical protein